MCYLVMLIVLLLNDVWLNVIMLSFVMLNVVVLSAVMLNVTDPPITGEYDILPEIT